jgi:predicted porin
MSSLSRINNFYRGDTRSYKIVVKYKNGSPVPLAGKTLWFTMKVDPDDADNLAVLQVKHVFPNNTESENGVGYLKLSSTQTDTIYPGEYWYDFQITEEIPGAPPIVITLDSDKVEILKDITRGNI